MQPFLNLRTGYGHDHAHDINQEIARRRRHHAAQRFLLFLIHAATWIIAGMAIGYCIRAYPATLDAPPIPHSALPIPHSYYFAATATNESGASDYSNEVTTTNPTPALAWNPSTNAVAYLIHRGRESGLYTNTWSAGSATNFTIPPPPPPPSNRVIRIWTQNATNIQYRPPGGTWMLANKTNLTFTNPPAAGLLYRPLGRSRYTPARAWITLTTQ